MFDNPSGVVKRSGAKRHTIQASEDVIKLLPLEKNKHVIPSGNLLTNASTGNKKASLFSPANDTGLIPINRKSKKNWKDWGAQQKTIHNTGKFNDLKIQPAFKQWKSLKDNGKDDADSNSIISGTKEENEKNKKEEELNFDSDEENENYDDDEEANLVTNEGYLIKLVENKLKKVWFKLIHKDLYYFKNNKDEIHKGMHNWSGVFIKEEPAKIMFGKKYFCFSMTYPKKTRVYYVESEAEYKVWVNKLKASTGYTNWTDIYEIGEKLGNGKFGLIKLATNKKTGEKVAVKIMSKADMTSSDLELVRTEIEILKICQHPNIIKLYEVFENIDFFYIIMEYCSGGDLFSYLEKRGFRLPEPQVCNIMHKMCAAVFYINSYGIAHRDLKPENVLMMSTDDNADIRILDFGLSKIIGPDEKCTEPYGTLSYVAPEVLLDEPYGKEVDEWSLGVITYWMISGSLPFDHKTDEEEIARKTVSDPPPYKGTIWKKVSADAKNFIDRLWIKDPKKRLTIKEALEHDWFRSMGKSNMINVRKQTKDVSLFELYSSVDEKGISENLSKK